MTRSANAAHSPRRRSAAAQRAGLVAVAALALLVIVQYLSGYFLLWSLHVPPLEATPLTTARYYHFYGDLPAIRRRLLWCSTLSVGLVAAALAAAAWPKPRPMHGAARFAHRGEIARAGLLGDQGLILGEVGRRYLMLDGQQGVALVAPPRSGKGVGLVIPNLLNWGGSAVVTDIKRENWTLTAGYRASRGHATYLFEPLSEAGATSCWNPLTYVSPNPGQRVNDLQRIAGMIYPDTPGTDPFWVVSARSVFVALGLYVFETPSMPKTIGEILRQGMASDDEGFGAHWKRIIAGRNSGRNPLSQPCVRALSDVIDLAPVTASSIRKTFTSRLDLWLNPILDAATSRNDFDLRDLRRRPMSIYVAVNPDDLHRLRPVLSLFFEQAIGLQTRVLPEHDPTLKYQVGMFLDEVPAMGPIPILAESIAYAPGYNVRIVLVFQAPSQLRQVYGTENAKTMLKSLAARIVYAPKDYEDAREISDELGFTTIKGKSVSKPLSLFSGQRGRRSMNQTVSDQRRALLLPQEVKELTSREAIIFFEGLRPILCRKIRYYEDRRFRARLLPAPKPPSVVTSDASTSMRAAIDPEVSNTAAQQESPPVTFREATLEDVEQIDSLTSEDFDGRFDHINLPEDRPPTPTELQRAAEQFLAAL
jgi:type IV secretion system protein VirD4